MREQSNAETPVDTLPEPNRAWLPAPEPEWTEDTDVMSFLNIHAGLSDVHRTLGELGNGEFGPLHPSQRTEVSRLEDTSLGILQELEGLIEAHEPPRPNGSGDVHRASAVHLGLATLLYRIEAGKKSGILSASDGGQVEVLYFSSGELGIPVNGTLPGGEGIGAEIRREILERVDRLLASRTALFEFTESSHSDPVRGLGLDTVRLILDGIGKHYGARELREALNTPDGWQILPGAMRAISNLPLSAGEMSIVRLLGAGWADELAHEPRVENQVLPLAAALYAFGLLGTGSEFAIGTSTTHTRRPN